MNMLTKSLLLAVVLSQTACGGGGSANVQPAPAPAQELASTPVISVAEPSRANTALPAAIPEQDTASAPVVAPGSGSGPTPAPIPALAQPQALAPTPTPTPTSTSTSTSTSPAVTPLTSAVNRTVLGVLVSTPTRPSQRTVQELQDALFSSTKPSVRSFYWLESGGRLNVTNATLLPPETPITAGDVIEVTIDAPTGDDCESGSWADRAKLAAAQQGFDPAKYNSTVYITPKVSGCGSNAVGTQGTIGAAKKGLRVVYFDKAETPATSPLTLRTLVHEIGHNIGLNHARTVTCLDATGTRVSMSSACTEDTQGDPTDGMGTTGRVVNPGPAPGDDYSAMDTNPRLFAAPRAYDAGWVLPSEVGTVTGAGYYRLRPLYCSSDNGAPRALRLPSTNAGRDYWLETRIACGGAFDNFRNGSTHHKVPETTVNGLLIRQAYSDAAQAARYTWLLDLHPATTSSSSGFVDAALKPGEVFVDPLPGGWRFEITAVDADGTIEVHIW